MFNPLAPTHPLSIVLALGSNLGDRLKMLCRARDLLDASGIRIIANSRLYWTKPLKTFGTSEPSQPSYLNAAVAVQTSLDPLSLWRRCLAVERAMGRIRRARWESRNIDIDLIVYGNVRMAHPELTLPHPRWMDRDFVLAPLLDLGMMPPPDDGFCSRAQMIARLARAEKNILTSQLWNRPLC